MGGVILLLLCYLVGLLNFVDFMHAIKGGWTGHPLALAKNNEPEGRKTRIRRSKEERKAMVEVFIKK